MCDGVLSGSWHVAGVFHISRYALCYILLHSFLPCCISVHSLALHTPTRITHPTGRQIDSAPRHCRSHSRFQKGAIGRRALLEWASRGRGRNVARSPRGTRRELFPAHDGPGNLGLSGRIANGPDALPGGPSHHGGRFNGANALDQGGRYDCGGCQS
jgi:hypothetical protein